MQRRRAALSWSGWRRAAGWAIAIAGAIVLPLAITALAHLLVFRHLYPSESFKLAAEVASVIVAAGVFAWHHKIGEDHDNWKWLAVFFILAVGVVVLFGIVWILLGAWLLPLGLRVASMLPVVAVCLEMLVKGECPESGGMKAQAI